MKASSEVEEGVSDVEGGAGFDGEGGAGGVQLSSRKSRRCPAIFGFVSLPVRYPQSWQLYYHAAISDL